MMRVGRSRRCRVRIRVSVRMLVLVLMVLVLLVKMSMHRSPCGGGLLHHALMSRNGMQRGIRESRIGHGAQQPSIGTEYLSFSDRCLSLLNMYASGTSERLLSGRGSSDDQAAERTADWDS